MAAIDQTVDRSPHRIKLPSHVSIHMLHFDDYNRFGIMSNMPHRIKQPHHRLDLLVVELQPEISQSCTHAHTYIQILVYVRTHTRMHTRTHAHTRAQVTTVLCRWVVVPSWAEAASTAQYSIMASTAHELCLVDCAAAVLIQPVEHTLSHSSSSRHHRRIIYMAIVWHKRANPDLDRAHDAR